MSERKWIRRAAWLFAPILLIGAFLSIRALTRDCRELGDVDDFEPLIVYEAGCAPVFIVSSRPEPVVILALTPHLPNEPLEWVEPDHVFAGLHGERYATNGQQLGGPPTEPLMRCPIEIRGTGIYLATRSADLEDLRQECDEPLA